MKTAGQILLVATIVILGACSKRQQVVYDQPEQSVGGHWETAWVDPELVITDSLFTLIRTERIDSFFVNEPLSEDVLPAAVHFQVDASKCFVAVSVVDANGAILMPLIARTLPTGYYKFTVYPNQFNEQLFAGRGYLLKAHYCGHTRFEPIDFR